MYLKEYEQAAEMLQLANALERHDITYMQLGKVVGLFDILSASMCVKSSDGCRCTVYNRCTRRQSKYTRHSEIRYLPLEPAVIHVHRRR